ncbi:hypothetical protein GQ54DRAFT_78541 [Martensiomyces pterosporus]|nr:hypothetical protein GQ54DRAFT_78541 [Martensiomyces pterosporus]
MSGTSTAASAAASAPDYSRAMSTTKDPHLTSPFPELESDHEGDRDRSKITATVSAEALTNAIADAITTSTDSQPTVASTQTEVQAVSSVPSTNGVQEDNSVLASLHRTAHDQAMEIINSYQSNARRRRSSVEAVAAASSVLASFASSAKSHMGGDVAAAAAAVAAAVNSPPAISQINTYSGHATQRSAAAALLAASSLQPVMLPTIPSGSTSLQGTPGPVDRLTMSSAIVADATTVPAADSAMASFDVSAFGALPAHVFTSSAADQMGAGLPAVTQADAAAFSLQQQQQQQGVPTTRSSADSITPTKQPGRRRKAAAGVLAATAAVASTADGDDSVSDEQDENDFNTTSNGMPLTPDAPGSGRPGSLRHLTPDERRARRLQRNRLAAKECRQKKKAYINNLEAQVDDLREENAQLRKEIEELNAKLTLGGMRSNSATGTPTLHTKSLPLPDHAHGGGSEHSSRVASEASLAEPAAYAAAPVGGSPGSKRPRISARPADGRSIDPTT